MPVAGADAKTQAESAGRAMLAWQAYSEMKAKYESALSGLPEGSEERERAAKELHREGAQRALRVARENGGVYVKAAQFLASLQGGAGDNGVPAEYVEALAELTDRAPPRGLEEVREVVEEDLGSPLEELFQWVEPEPVAAASLAQVHRAKARGGEEVAVKVQYPWLRRQAEADLQVLESMAASIRPRGLDLSWLAADFRANLLLETDFRSEAANARALPADSSLFVPLPLDALSSSRVLTTPFVRGLSRVSDCRSKGFDPLSVGDSLARSFSRMALVYGRIHGDPHLGNVYVRPHPSDPQRPQCVLLDHGLYYRVDDPTRRQLCDLVLACIAGRRGRIRAISREFAGQDLGRFLPLLFSPYFILGSELKEEDVRAAREERLPKGVRMEEVAGVLEKVRGEGGGLLGVLHSFGYTRGMLNGLGYPERRRLQWLGEAALEGSRGKPPSRLATCLLAARVRTLCASVSLLHLVASVPRSAWAFAGCLASAALGYFHSSLRHPWRLYPPSSS